MTNEGQTPETTNEWMAEFNEGQMLDAVDAELFSHSDYVQIRLTCSPGYVYVINDLPGQTATYVEFSIDIMGPQDGYTKRVRVNGPIGPNGYYLPIRIPLTSLDRMGQLRNFVFGAEPGGIAGVEQTVGERGKSYSWHVIWLHNSLRNP